MKKTDDKEKGRLKGLSLFVNEIAIHQMSVLSDVGGRNLLK